MTLHAQATPAHLHLGPALPPAVGPREPAAFGTRSGGSRSGRAKSGAGLSLSFPNRLAIGPRPRRSGLGLVSCAGRRSFSAKPVPRDRSRRQTASPAGPAVQTSGAQHIPLAGSSPLVDSGRAEADRLAARDSSPTRTAASASPGRGNRARTRIGPEAVGGLGSLSCVGRSSLSAKPVPLDRFRRQTASLLDPPAEPPPQYEAT